MQRKFIYLINPISGVKNKFKLKRDIIDSTTLAAVPFELIDTRADDDYSFLPAYIEQHSITDVIICGGDGSVSTVTSFLLGTNVSVGIVPTGSGNGLALAARIPYSTKKALNIIINGHAALIDGYLINDKFSCMMCGMGNDAQVAHDFALSKVRGLKTYIQLSAKRFFALKSFRFVISTSEGESPVNAFFITVSNSNQFGNYVTIAPRASLNDGLLDVVVVKKMSRLFLPIALMNQIVGINSISEIHNKGNRKKIVYFQTRELIIKNLDYAPLHIDGEPQPTTEEIKIKILPGAFRLLQPSL